MSKEYELNPAEQELERALGGLKPASPRLERDRLMFRAGQASINRKQIVWPSLSGVLALMLVVSWMIRLLPEKRTVAAAASKSVTVARDYSRGQGILNGQRIARDSEPVSGSYWQLRNRVARRGLESLTLEQSGFQSGGVEVWRPFKPASSDDFEMKM